MPKSLLRRLVSSRDGSVILETALLTIEEKLLACELAVAAGADLVKTSTGYANGGATTDDIALMRGSNNPLLASGPRLPAWAWSMGLRINPMPLNRKYSDPANIAR